MYIILDEFLLRNLESDDLAAGAAGAGAAGAAGAGAATIFEFIREFVGAAGVLELLVPKIFPRKSIISTFRLYFFYI
jgi:hypothetical protein